MVYFLKKTKDSQNGMKLELLPMTPDYSGVGTQLHYLENPNSILYKHYNEPMKTECKICDGHYVLRQGKFGNFFGCSNFPKCKSTKSFTTLTYLILKRNGINIYESERTCWKCGKKIKITAISRKLISF